MHCSHPLTSSVWSYRASFKCFLINSVWSVPTHINFRDNLFNWLQHFQDEYWAFLLRRAMPFRIVRVDGNIFHSAKKYDDVYEYRWVNVATRRTHFCFAFMMIMCPWMSRQKLQVRFYPYDLTLAWLLLFCPKTCLFASIYGLLRAATSSYDGEWMADTGHPPIW